MTVLENVMVGRHPRTRSGFLAGMLDLPWTWREERESKAKALAILEDLGLGIYAGETASNLSLRPATARGVRAGPGDGTGFAPAG